MKRRYRSQRMLAFRVAVLSAGSALAAALAINALWLYFVPLVLLLVSLYLYILRRQRGFIDRMMFMFDSVENDDYTFRFDTNPRRVDDSLLNIALNRVKDLMLGVKSEIIEKERYYEQIMDSVSTGIITVGDNGNVYQVNREALRIFGIPRLSHLRQLSTTAPLAARSIAAIEAGNHRRISYVNECGTVNLSLDCSETVIGTRRMRIVAVNDLAGAMDETEVESWNKLTRILTHEIMNSLSPVTSLSDTLLSMHRRTDDQMGRGLQTIADTARRLTAFTESFRRFTRIPEPHKASEEISALIHTAAELVRSETGVPVRITAKNTKILVWADADQISQVLINLLKNAAEAVKDIPDGTVEIECSLGHEESVVVDVTDNGPAIPAGTVENIFTPFFTTKPGGSGIGLSICRRIVQLHGGSLRLVRNSPGRVTFQLKLS